MQLVSAVSLAWRTAVSIGIRVRVRLSSDPAVIMEPIKQVLMHRLRQGLACTQSLRDQCKGLDHVCHLLVMTDSTSPHPDGTDRTHEVGVDDHCALEELEAHLAVDLSEGACELYPYVISGINEQR